MALFFYVYLPFQGKFDDNYEAVTYFFFIKLEFIFVLDLFPSPILSFER